MLSSTAKWLVLLLQAAKSASLVEEVISGLTHSCFAAQAEITTHRELARSSRRILVTPYDQRNQFIIVNSGENARGNRRTIPCELEGQKNKTPLAGRFV